MNMLRRSQYTGPHPIRLRGIALIEALIALAIMVGGVAAIFGVHGYVVGTSAESRLQTAAMSLAQEKSEEIRTVAFADLDLESVGSEKAQIRVPGIGRSSNISLEVCWGFVETGVAGLVEDSLVQVNVSVVRDGETCNPGGAGIASLSTLLAQQDPRVAARNTRDQMLRDGEGKLLDALPEDIAKDEEDGRLTSAPGPGGFEFYRDDQGLVAAVVNPETGQAMVPRDGGQLKVANIHGNLILRGDYSDVRGLQVGAAGVAFCRVQYPDSSGMVIYPNDATYAGATPPLTPTISGPSTDATVTYVQYTCVVADGWRRAIFPRFPDEEGVLARDAMRVCTGYPALQTTSLVEGVWVPTGEDVLDFSGRFYVGYTGTIDDSGDYPVISNRGPHGVRGAADGKSAVVGSICVDGQDCWKDANLRGWIPGGHHFFIDKKDDSPAYCSQSMAVLAEIDEAMEVRGYDEDDNEIVLAPKTLFQNILFRNPEKVYCTSEKEYTTALIQRLFADQEIPSTDCLSHTRVSGFFARADSVVSDTLDGNQLRVTSSSRFAGGCKPMGEFGAPGSGRVGNGAYVCGFGESIEGLNLEAFIPNTPFTFEAGYDNQWLPSLAEAIKIADVPLDVAWMNFEADVFEPSLTIAASVASMTPAEATLAITGTSLGLKAPTEISITIEDSPGVTRVKNGETVSATILDGGVYSTSAVVTVVAARPELTITATAEGVMRDGTDLVATPITVDLSDGVSNEDPPSASCNSFTVVTASYSGGSGNGSLRPDTLRRVSPAPEVNGTCDEEKGQGSNYTSTCTIGGPRVEAAPVREGQVLQLEYSERARNGWVPQTPPVSITVTEQQIANKCQATGVQLQ